LRKDRRRWKINVGWGWGINLVCIYHLKINLKIDEQPEGGSYGGK